jgi:hypothetical protein
MDQRYGGVPSEAASVTVVYATPTVPLGSAGAVVMVGPGVTVRLSGGLLTVVGVLSVTCRTTVVEVVALAARGPEMAPVLALNVSPAGKPVIDQVYGGAPPVALGDALYGALASPAGKEVVCTASGGGGAGLIWRL